MPEGGLAPADIAAPRTGVEKPAHLDGTAVVTATDSKETFSTEEEAPEREDGGQTQKLVDALKEKCGADDVMCALDVLSERKREKKIEDILDVFQLLGLLTSDNDSERDSICDFEGVPNMMDVVRNVGRYVRGGVDRTADSGAATEELCEEEDEEEEDKFDDKIESLEYYRQLYAKYDDFRQDSEPSRTENTHIRVLTTFCNSLKGICHKSNLNRGVLREQHAVEEVVCFLEYCLKQTCVKRLSKATLETSIAAACSALKSLCAGNDGNKKVAAGIAGVLNQEGLSKTDCLDPTVPTMAKGDDETGKAIDLLLQAVLPDNDKVTPGLSAVEEDVLNTRREILNGTSVQAHGIWAIRALVTDDDPRGQGSMVPSAVENRDYVANRVNFPLVREIIVASLLELKKDIDKNTEGLSSAEIGAPTIKTSEKLVLTPLQWYRLEGVLLLMKEVGCHQERIHKFVFEDNVLPLIKDTLAFGHASIVRACLYVLRQFAFSDHMKDLFTWGDAEITRTAVLVLKKFSDNTSIVEQCFGLFSNVSLRKPAICETLNADPLRISAIGVLLLGQYRHNAGICTTVLYTLRNVSKAVPEAAKEVEESGLFPLIRDIYFAREYDMSRQWSAAKDIAKQFLREFREDSEGMRRKIEYNDYY